MSIIIKHIEYYLPENILTNEQLAKQFPEWDIEKVALKTGVYSRHIADNQETAFDLSVKAVEKLLKKHEIDKTKIGGIVYCTQSPDYILPANSFLLHKHLKLPSSVVAFDINLACSGYVYGLAIIRGLIETGIADNILFVTADTYSKYINKADRSTRSLFGDGAAVSLISGCNEADRGIIDLLLASSGNEYDTFYIPSGGCRLPRSSVTTAESIDRSGNVRSQEDILMNGFAVWKFISSTVPSQINELLRRNDMTFADLKNLFFHQASKLTLDSLAQTLKVDPQKVFMNLEHVGNTVSASIPIALKDAEDKGILNRKDLILLSGFGVGLSWGSIILKY